MLRSNPLKVRLELSPVVCHSFSFQRSGWLWGHWELAVPEGDGFKQLLVLQLGVGHSDSVLGTELKYFAEVRAAYVWEVERTCHREN